MNKQWNYPWKKAGLDFMQSRAPTVQDAYQASSAARWLSDQEIGTAISCMECSQVTLLYS